MKKKNKILKRISFIIAAAVGMTFVAGFFNVPAIDGAVDSDAVEKVSFFDRAEIDINSAVNLDDCSESDENNEENGMIEILFTVVGMMVSGNGALFFTIVLLKKIRIKGFLSSGTGRRRLINISRIRYYKGWCVQFLSPVQIWMQNRADELDINPLGFLHLWRKQPAFCTDKTKCGFFL